MGAGVGVSVAVGAGVAVDVDAGVAVGCVVGVGWGFERVGLAVASGVRCEMVASGAGVMLACTGAVGEASGGVKCPPV